MRRLLSSTCAVCVLATVGACKRETQVYGDVFIVTKGRQNVKLALVDVAFITEAQMTSHAASKVAAAKAYFLEKQGSVSELQAQADEAEAAKDAAWAKYTEKSQQLQAMSRGAADYPRATALIRFYDKVVQPISMLHTSAQKLALEKRLALLSAQLDAYRLTQGPALFADLPPAAAAATTDADGKFTVTLKPGRYGVVARSTRFVGGDKDEGNEEYFWFVWLTLDGEREKRVMLSNDNQLDTNCSECIFKESEFNLGDSPREKTL